MRKCDIVTVASCKNCLSYREEINGVGLTCKFCSLHDTDVKDNNLCKFYSQNDLQVSTSDLYKVVEILRNELD